MPNPPISGLRLGSRVTSPLHADQNQLSMKRPLLEPYPLSEVFPPRPGTVTITMSIGQWDVLHAVFYQNGAILLELDDDERPVAAYRKREFQLSA